MKIIFDSNIWLGTSISEIDKCINIKCQSVFVTFSNLLEFSKSSKIVNNPNQLRTILKFISSNGLPIIYDPPFIHIKKLDDPNYYFDFENEYKLLLGILDYLEGDLDLSEELLNELEIYRKKVNERIKSVSDFFNKKAEEIRRNLSSEEKADKFQTTEGAKELVSFYVRQETNGNQLSENFDWSQITLFLEVLTSYFKELSLGSWRSTSNDWHDIFITAYVQPKDQFWTKEQKWIDLLKSLELQRFLYIS